MPLNGAGTCRNNSGCHREPFHIEALREFATGPEALDVEIIHARSLHVAHSGSAVFFHSVNRSIHSHDIDHQEKYPLWVVYKAAHVEHFTNG